MMKMFIQIEMEMIIAVGTVAQCKKRSSKSKSQIKFTIYEANGKRSVTAGAMMCWRVWWVCASECE